MLNLKTFTGRFVKRHNPSKTPVRKCAANIDSYYKLYRMVLFINETPKSTQFKKCVNIYYGNILNRCILYIK